MQNTIYDPSAYDKVPEMTGLSYPWTLHYLFQKLFKYGL